MAQLHFATIAADPKSGELDVWQRSSPTREYRSATMDERGNLVWHMHARGPLAVFQIDARTQAGVRKAIIERCGPMVSVTPPSSSWVPLKTLDENLRAAVEAAASPSSGKEG